MLILQFNYAYKKQTYMYLHREREEREQSLTREVPLEAMEEEKRRTEMVGIWNLVMVLR